MVFFMQDGPFLFTRLYAISLGVTNFMFFTLKNFITLILGLYRLLVLCGCIGREGNDLLRKSEIARSMDDLTFDDNISKKGRNKNNKTMKPKNRKQDK